MNADGRSEVDVTNSPKTDDREPGWSPDGTQIVLSTNRDGNYEVYRMNADGSGAVNLTKTQSDETSVTWAADGSIVFSSYRSGVSNLYRMAADGSDVVQITRSDTANDTVPASSPDGGKIAFSRVEGSGQGDIFAVSSDGSGLVNLSNAPDSWEDEPAWAPKKPTQGSN